MWEEKAFSFTVGSCRTVAVTATPLTCTDSGAPPRGSRMLSRLIVTAIIVSDQIL